MAAALPLLLLWAALRALAWRWRRKRTLCSVSRLRGGTGTTFVLFPGLWMSPRELLRAGTFPEGSEILGVRLLPGDDDFDPAEVAERVRRELLSTAQGAELHVVGFSMGAVPAQHLAASVMGVRLTLVAPAGGGCRGPLAWAMAAAAWAGWAAAGTPRILTRFPRFGPLPPEPPADARVVWGSEDAVHPPQWGLFPGCTREERPGLGHWGVLRGLVYR